MKNLRQEKVAHCLTPENRVADQLGLRARQSFVVVVQHFGRPQGVDERLVVQLGVVTSFVLVQ